MAIAIFSNSLIQNSKLSVVASTDPPSRSKKTKLVLPQNIIKYLLDSEKLIIFVEVVFNLNNCNLQAEIAEG